LGFLPDLPTVDIGCGGVHSAENRAQSVD
jgi:hypothetical protein